MIDDPRVLGPETSCEDALDIIVAGCASDLDVHLGQFMRTPAPEGPHKARVALRRLTTALDAFGNVLKRKRTAKIRRDAKAMFRMLGEVRDADVYLARQSGNPGGLAGAETLSAEVDALRHRIRKALQKEGAVGFAQDVVQQIKGGRLFRDGAAGRTARVANVAILAAKAVGDAADACFAHGDDISHMNAVDRHEFRKDLKSLRYLSEFFVHLWPGAVAVRFLDEMQALQNELGALNDIANLRKREGRSDAHADEEADALRRADAVWDRLSRTKPWWSATKPADRRKARPDRG